MKAVGNRITFAGNMIVDNIKMIPVWPEKGRLVQITDVKHATGGAVSNSGIDLKRLDATIEVSALGFVGDDSNGRFYIDYLADNGIDTSRIGIVKGVPTSFTDCMTVIGSGERTFFNMHGADSRLTPDDVDVNKLDCDLFHFGYILLLDGMDAPDEEYGTKAARLLAKVQAAGIKTSIDVVSEQSERFSRILRPALRHCDFVVINEIEASTVTGVSVDDMRGMCEALLKLGVKERVVIHKPELSASMGADGSYCEVGSLVLPEGWIVGSTGAGDAFCAGMLYSFLKGLDPEPAMRLASCAAAMNLAAPDATSGAKSYEETIAIDSRFSRR